MRLALCFAFALAADPISLRCSVPAGMRLDSSAPVTCSQSAPRSLAATVQHPSGGTYGASPVPEPSTLLLVGTGLLGVALTTRLRRRRPN